MIHPLIRSRLPLWLSLSGIAVFVLIYVGVYPHYQAAIFPLYTPADLYIPRLIDVVIVTWSFWVGSAVGSFLNVVAWRMPRGESLNGDSRCPRCITKLRSRHNFPVFGWMILAGRCYSCRLPISKRYPIVEFIVGAFIAWVAVGQIFRLSLPGYYHQYEGSSPLWTPYFDRVGLSLLIFHVYALSAAWAFALVRYDRNRLPGRLIAWSLGPVIVAMIAQPHFAVVSWRMGETQTASPTIDAVVRVLTSLVVAGLVGRSLARGLCPTADPKLDPLGKSTGQLIDLVVLLTIPALVVGWQAVLAVIAIASVLAVMLQRLLLRQTDRFGSFAVALPIVLSAYLFFWWRLNLWWPMPSPNSSPSVILVWATVLLVAPLWLRQKEQTVTTTLAPEDQHSTED